MSKTYNSTPLSKNDDYRLKSVFFNEKLPSASSPVQEKSRAKLIFIGIAVSLFLAFFLFRRSLDKDTTLNSHTTSNGSFNLLTNPVTASIKFITQQLDNSYTGSTLSFVVRPHATNGFNMNFQNHLDLNDFTLVLTIGETSTPFTMKTILRDVNFFSNAKDPFLSKITPSQEPTTIAVNFQERDFPQLNLLLIKQMRFIFTQEGDSPSPILIKHVALQKKEVK